jgi:hypothetical protein
MKKGGKIAFIIVVILVIGFGVIQLIPIDRINPPVQSDIQAPPDVKAIVKVSCYDCHSHETVWPWYSRIAPISWLIASDAKEGREKLNFSTWDQYTPEKQHVLISDMLNEMKEGGMPPWFYTIKHSDAKISPDKLKILEAWEQAYAKPGQEKKQ